GPPDHADRHGARRRRLDPHRRRAGPPLRAAAVLDGLHRLHGPARRQPGAAPAVVVAGLRRTAADRPVPPGTALAEPRRRRALPPPPAAPVAHGRPHRGPPPRRRRPAPAPRGRGRRDRRPSRPGAGTAGRGLVDGRDGPMGGSSPRPRPAALPPLTRAGGSGAPRPG